MVQPVGMKRVNDWILYDMHGNVSEWVWDGYSETLTDGADPALTPDGPVVIRGGSF